MEFVVERLMQEFKTAIGRCVTQSPEKTYINGVLLGRALRRIEASHPGIRDLPGVVVAGGGLPARAKRWRGAEDSGPHQRLLGMGRPVPARYKEEIGQSVRHYVQRNRPQGWSVADAMSVLSRRGRGSVLRFQRGFCNEHEVFAESYGRAKNRANYWVQVRFEAAAATATHVARVLRFVLVPHPELPDVAPLRLAICAVHRALPPLGRAIRAVAEHVDLPMYAVDVDAVDCKLVSASPNGYKVGMMYFRPCVTMTER